MKRKSRLSQCLLAGLMLVFAAAPIVAGLPAPSAHAADTLFDGETTGAKPAEAAAQGGTGGEQIYEAEDAVLSGAEVDNKHVGFTGTGFVDYKPNAPGGYIEWTVEVPADGEYILEIRYSNGSSANRPAEIQVNGEVVEANLAYLPTGDHAQYMTTETKAVLHAGKNTVRATATGPEGGANTDHLKVYPASEKKTAAETTPAKTYPEMQVTEVSNMLSDALAGNLASAGIVVSVAAKPEGRDVTRSEFMHMINRALGYQNNDKMPNVEHGEIWEVSSSEYSSYILETAKSAGYISGYADGTVKPNQAVSRQEAAVMAANVLKLAPNASAAAALPDAASVDDWAKGAVGAVVAEKLLPAKADGKFAPQAGFKRSEAEELVKNLAAKAPKSASQVNIARVDAVANDIIVVTLDGVFDKLDLKDIAFLAATGSWAGLTPDVNRDVPVKQAAQAINAYGDTVAVYQLHEPLAKGATYASEVKQAARFEGDLQEAIEKAGNIVSWQMDHGGWDKGMEESYARKWDGASKRSKWLGPDNETELGTIDNDATTNEIRFIAQVYRESGREQFKQSVEKGLDFLLTMQYPSGGWPQVYPERGKEGELIRYSNYVTFNDGAMIKVMTLFDDILNKKYPFDKAWLDPKYEALLQKALDKGIDYILKAQIRQNGKLTAWCAQHDPVTYEPQHARSYEHPSISGFESVGIVKFLMSRPNQTPEIKQAIRGALEWFDAVKLEGTRYVSADKNGEYFVKDANSTAWYRFYDLQTNEPIFSGRDGVIKRNIMEIEEERRNNYSWGGSYASQLLDTAKSVGFYENRVYAKVVGTNSTDKAGNTLTKDQLRVVKDSTRYSVKSKMVVSQDGTGDYTTVQAAIDAVPADNGVRVEIFIKNGVYKEVVTVPANKPFIALIGESSTGTVLSYDNYAGKEKPGGGTYGTSGSASVFVYANDFSAENLTIENTFDESTDTKGKQAVALRISGERGSFKNVRFLGNQDTLYTYAGSQYFYQCYIEGDVDFIFGGARAVFEECEIVSYDRKSADNNGYVTAASTLITQPYGFLFYKCKFTSAAADNSVWLGRPWHPSNNPDAIGSVVIMNSYLGPHIKTAGWTDMSGFKAADARFYEYKNEGPGAVVNEMRRQLTDEQAKEWTIENVLNGWNPKK